MADLREGESVVVGAGADCDIVVAESVVSTRHIRIARTGGRLYVHDLGSSNGTHVDGFRVTQCEVTLDSRLGLGSWQSTVRAVLDRRRGPRPAAAAEPVPPRPAHTAPPQPGFGARIATGPQPATPAVGPAREVAVGERMVVLGRNADSDVVIAEPAVSAPHARVFRSGGRLVLEDLGSRNGTHVRSADGTWESYRHCVLHQGDVVRIGSQQFRFVRAPGREAPAAGARLDVADLDVIVNDRRSGLPLQLLHAVSFTVLPGEVVGILGPSGSGKTTLLNVLAGFDHPARGTVRIQGAPLFQPDGAVDAGIGALVGHAPQFDVVHGLLTVEEAVRASARLRGTAHWSDSEIDARVTQALRDVGLEARRDVRLGTDTEKTLSGGQRKRVNIAMELVLDPPVLLLDEPTSGLSSHDTAELMRLLRRLADAGRTVVLTIHQPSYSAFVQMDQALILEEGGHVAWFGPTAIDVFEQYNVTDREPEALLERMARKARPSEPGPWALKYAGSEARKRFVEGRAHSLGQTATAPPARI
ncbi:MAG: ATP-binding cassette domain-containing protein, partial [Myxococcales bacterium]|nr:ATP-binding cassette domain-containing protein [Myxococcales bacterium]